MNKKILKTASFLLLSQTVFAQDGVFKQLLERVLWENKECVKKSIILEGNDPTNEGLTQKAELHRYIPLKKKEYETHVVIIPPTSPPRGEATSLDKWYAEELCSEGVGSVILDNWDGYTEADPTQGGPYDFGTHDRAAMRAINVGKMALNYLDTPVLVMGTSVGAIYGSILMGKEEQIIGGVLIVGGAPLVEILKTTDQEIPRTLREVRMEKLGIKSLADYEKLLSENVHLGPENFIVPAKAPHILMVTALKDTTVPTATQEKLWEMWGKPTRIEHHADHFHTILKSFAFERKKIKNFLLKEVEESQPRVPSYD